MRLGSAWEALDGWLASVAPRQHLDDLCASPDQIIPVLERYVQYLYQTKRKLSHAVEAVLAVQWRHRALRGSLTEVWDAVYSWKEEVALNMRISLPENLMLAASRWSMARGLRSTEPKASLWVRFSIAFKTGFYSLLRPSELSNLLRVRVHVPFDSLLNRVHEAILFIVEAKNWKHVGKFQFVTLRDLSAIDQLSWLIDGLRPLTFISASIAQMRRSLHIALEALHLVGLGIVMASLRAGGATFWFRVTRDFHIVKFIRRWKNYQNLLHHIQESTAAMILMRVSIEAELCVLHLSGQLTCLDFPPPAHRSQFFGLNPFQAVDQLPAALANFEGAVHGLLARRLVPPGQPSQGGARTPCSGDGPGERLEVCKRLRGDKLEVSSCRTEREPGAPACFRPLQFGAGGVDDRRDSCRHQHGEPASTAHFDISNDGNAAVSTASSSWPSPSQRFAIGTVSESEWEHEASCRHEDGWILASSVSA